MGAVIHVYLNRLLNAAFAAPAASLAFVSPAVDALYFWFRLNQSQKFARSLSAGFSPCGSAQFFSVCKKCRQFLQERRSFPQSGHTMDLPRGSSIFTGEPQYQHMIASYYM